MGSLSIKGAPNPRKRPASGSPAVLTDVNFRADTSVKLSRNSSGHQQTTSSPVDHPSSQAALSPRNPAQPVSPVPKPPSRNHKAALQTSGPAGDQRRHLKQRAFDPLRSTAWFKKRPKGAHVSGEDQIKFLTSLHAEKGLKSNIGSGSHSVGWTGDDTPDGLLPHESIVKQPDSRPISQQQLATEVKGIYSGLVIVEAKCVNVVNEHSQTPQHAQSAEKTKASVSQVEHYPALIALHRTLLHEHHDFFLASQHPSAGKSIKELATKYSMPARMWKHGIHNFLELLRHRLPDSLEYMLAFIYLAYQMMALLFETVPTFEDTWIECLGDLARYRMAIEDEDIRDRENWTNVARYWYMRAADKNCDVGRLLPQLSLYCRSLIANQPFISSRESILTLFEPALARLGKANPARPMSNDLWFVIWHASMFGVKVAPEVSKRAQEVFLSGLDSQLAQLSSRSPIWGAWLASCNIAALLKYGCTDSGLRGSLAPQEKPSDRPSCRSPPRERGVPDPDDIAEDDATQANVSVEWHFFIECCKIAFRRTGDTNVLPLVSVILVFLWSLSRTPHGAVYINRFIPWDVIATYINALNKSLERSWFSNTIASQKLPQPGEKLKLLPEYYVERGQVWSNDTFPANYFATASLDIDSRFIEDSTYIERRKSELKLLAAHIAFNKHNATGNTLQTSSTADRSGDNISSPENGKGKYFKTRIQWLDYDDRTETFRAVSWSGHANSDPYDGDLSPEPMSGVIAT
ncbi:MAG: hypothetical protein Q9159_006939 [Coniocarpon cinnabarinum]